MLDKNRDACDPLTEVYDASIASGARGLSVCCALMLLGLLLAGCAAGLQALAFRWSSRPSPCFDLTPFAPSCAKLGPGHRSFSEMAVCCILLRQEL